LPSGVQLFSLFDSNPQILDLVLDIVATAPSLATYLARNASVLDAVLSGVFFQPLPDKDALVKDLQQALSTSDDYEDKLNITRRWQKELHFRLGVLQLRNIADAFEASLAYSELAQACIIGLLPVVEAEFARKHGYIEGSGLAILAMGKLGSNEMTATSDLDMIVIYDPAGQEGSNGKRPLATVQYYARLTQALVTAMSTLTSEGRLYEVDMRLRPSGRSGPVATSVSGFEDYQKNKAWVWEHLALSRACVVAGAPDVISQVQDIRENIICSDHKRAEIMTEVACWFQHPLVRGAGVPQRIPTANSSSTDDMLPAPIQKAVQLFSESFDDPISMTEVASIVGLSPRQMERKFKQATGQTPISYYRSKRMKAARQLVLYSGDNMSEIALAVGYATAAPLVNYYKEEFGCSPQDDRERINMFRVAQNAPVPSV